MKEILKVSGILNIVFSAIYFVLFRFGLWISLPIFIFLLVSGIIYLNYSKIEDLSEVKRVELHAHSKMSQMDGVADETDLVSTAMKFGMKAVAITDHNGVQGFPHVFNMVTSHNKKLKEAQLNNSEDGSEHKKSNEDELEQQNNKQSLKDKEVK